MKKVYEKPQVYMERFELAEHIAGCNFTFDNESGHFNGYVDGEYIENAFISQTEGCGTPLGSYCYFNGSINNATITS